MKARLILIATLLLGTLTFAAPVAAGCDPARASSVANLFVEWRQGSSATAVYDNLSATIEEDDVFLESGGVVRQYISYRGVNSDGTAREVRVGIEQSSVSGTRLYMAALEPSGNVTKYYSYTDSNNQAPVRINRVTSTKYEVFTGSTLMTTFFFDVGWTPKTASKWVTSNNHGNQIPGRDGNAAYFLNATYTTQYGSGGFAGTAVLPNPFPSGATFGSNSTGMWTRDRC